MTFELFLIFLVVIPAIALLSEVARLLIHPPPAKKPKKKFLKHLLHSKPIPPKHQPPSPLKEGKEGITRDVQQFFADFEDFADVVNCWLADPHVGGPWRLQELPDAELSLDVSDSPTRGRRYAVFHNQERLGTLEVSDFFYRTEAPRVITRLRLDYVRLLSFDAVRNFLSAIALHTCDASPNSKEYSQAAQAIDRAMTEVLWQTQQISTFGMNGKDWGKLDLRLDGTAGWYFERRQALRNRAVTQIRAVPNSGRACQHLATGDAGELDARTPDRRRAGEAFDYARLPLRPERHSGV
jgi:hypothetical protein